MLIAFVLRAAACFALVGEPIEGRLVDAATGAPVAGATLEAWTEGWEQEARLVSRTASDARGAFLLELPPDSEASKLRLRAPGYRSTVLPLSDGDGELALHRAPAPIAARVLDLQGRPVAGARLTTHQTCAHAPPAAEATSGPGGVLRVPDFPPLEDDPDVRIEADGFEALHGLDPERLACEPGGEPPTIRLARRVPLEARFVEPDGRPAEGLRVLCGTAPRWHGAATDAEGRVRFASPFGRNLLLHTFDGGAQRSLAEVWLRPEPLPPLSARGGLRAGGGEEDGTLTIEVAPQPSVVHDCVPLRAVHERGQHALGAGTFDFPPGRIRLLHGAPFSGWAPGETRVLLQPGAPQRIVVRARPEPRLRLSGLADGDLSVVVEADGDSVRVEVAGPDLEVPVPGGAPLTVAIAAPDGTWIARLPGLWRDATLPRPAFEQVDAR